MYEINVCIRNNNYIYYACDQWCMYIFCLYYVRLFMLVIPFLLQELVITMR